MIDYEKYPEIRIIYYNIIYILNNIKLDDVEKVQKVIEDIISTIFQNINNPYTIKQDLFLKYNKLSIFLFYCNIKELLVFIEVEFLEPYHKEICEKYRSKDLKIEMEKFKFKYLT